MTYSFILSKMDMFGMNVPYIGWYIKEVSAIHKPMSKVNAYQLSYPQPNANTNSFANAMFFFIIHTYVLELSRK